MLASTSRMALAVALASLPVCALAQTARDNATVETVIVTGTVAAPLSLTTTSSTGSRLGLTPLETPASIQIIPGELIRERGDTDLTQAVARAAGITNTASSGNGGTGLGARGFTGVDSVKRIYDGIEMFATNGTVTFPFDPWTVERVEVLSGPASVLYGTGAIGGLVNVVPRKPTPDHRENSIRLTAGSFKTVRGAIDSSGPITNKLSYRFDASSSISDGYVDRGDNSGVAISAALRYDVTPDLNVSLSVDFGDQQPMQWGGVPLVNFQIDPRTLGKNYGVLDRSLHYQDSWTQLKAEWKPRDWLTITSDLYVLDGYRRYYNVNTYAYQPATGLILRSGYSDLMHRTQQYGWVNVAAMKGKVFGFDNDAAIGFNINQNRFRFINPRPSATSLVDFDNSNPGMYLGSGPGTQARFVSHLEQRGFFFEDRVKLTSRFSLVGGVRIDWYNVNRNDLIAKVISEKSFSPSSWRIGGVYEIRDGLVVYAQYATATDALSSVASLTPANMAFDPTQGRQTEVGAKGSMLGGRAEWTLAAYQITKKNLLIPDQLNPGLSLQVGQQSSKGLEASVAFTLGHGFRVEANGTILDAQFDDFREVVAGVAVSRAGNTPTNVPKKAANLWLTWDIDQKWQTRVGLRYVGNRFSNTTNTRLAPGYTVLDAGVRWNFARRHTLDLRVSNLTDELYIYTANSDTQWRFAQPRAFEISWTAKFN